jgi:3-hydroxyisobutyrate dehydrogenase-like beta-hydroxyacid dehydrogenase
MSDTTTRLGFIGVGGMGSRMASRLLEAGYHLTVYDRSRDRTDPLQRAGAVVVGSPRELATVSDVLMSSVTDDAALVAVMYGEHGALSGAAPHTTIVDLSTVRPTTSRDLFAAARDKDVDVLDAPVSGSLPHAKEGQLVLFVGGEKSTFDRAAPLLNVLGNRVLHMGPSGFGTLTKLCANTLLGLGFEALAEAVALGERGGLSREQLLAALADTTVLSPSQRSKIANVTRDEYPTSFPLRLMFKDFSLILQQAFELSVAMPATAAAAQVAAVEHARESLLHTDDDASAVIRTLADWAQPRNEATARPCPSA